MSLALLELVPNVSEGRDPAALEAVVRGFAVRGARVIDLDASRGAHRAVITLVGEADALVEAAVSGARAAAEHIDLRRHAGAHTRMGALDVCPFVSLEGVLPGGGTMDEAVAAARIAAERIGELGIPAYLYGEAALSPHRRLLHEVRRAGFEELADRMPIDPPDAGPPIPHPSAGAVAVGARFFLVAFNVNLDTRDPALAEKIARRVREHASVRRGPDGRVVSSVPGRLRGVRARGWYVEDFDCAQVSTNVTDWRLAAPHEVLAAVRDEAAQLGVHVRGSELVGCVPLEPLRVAARAAHVVGDDATMVQAAVELLGLDVVKPFDARRKVLEWAVEDAFSPSGGSP